MRLHKDASGVAQALRRQGVEHRFQSLWRVQRADLNRAW